MLLKKAMNLAVLSSQSASDLPARQPYIHFIKSLLKTLSRRLAFHARDLVLGMRKKAGFEN